MGKRELLIEEGVERAVGMRANHIEELEKWARHNIIFYIDLIDNSTATPVTRYYKHIIRCAIKFGVY